MRNSDDSLKDFNVARNSKSQPPIALLNWVRDEEVFKIGPELIWHQVDLNEYGGQVVEQAIYNVKMYTTPDGLYKVGQGQSSGWLYWGRVGTDM